LYSSQFLSQSKKQRNIPFENNQVQRDHKGMTDCGAVSHCPAILGKCRQRFFFALEIKRAVAPTESHVEK